jgi:uncharacterized protein
MNKLPIKAPLLFLLPFSVCLTNLQAAIQLPAAPSRYVTDYAGVLRADTADRLSGQLADFDHRTADELIIVIYPTLPKGVSIGDYTRQLYTAWKIGKRGKDTGALLLISTGEHQGFINAGRGLETKLTEEACKKIFVEKIAPRLDAGDYDGACKAAANELIAALSR